MRPIIFFVFSLLTICTQELHSTLPRDHATYVDHRAWAWRNNQRTPAIAQNFVDLDDAERTKLYALLNQNLGDDFLNHCAKSGFAGDFLLEIIHQYMIQYNFNSSQEEYTRWLKTKETLYREFLKAPWPVLSKETPFLDTYVLFLDQEKDPENNFPFVAEFVSMIYPKDSELFNQCTLKLFLKSLSFSSSYDIYRCFWSHPLSMEQDDLL